MREEPPTSGGRDSSARWWKRPEIVLGVPGLAIAAWTLAAELQPPADPVAECRKQHPEADGTPVQVDQVDQGQPPAYVIRGCKQPGTPGVGEDGLWQVDLSIYAVPGASSVDPVTQAELFLTDCPVLDLGYHYSRGHLAGNNRLVVQMGQVVFAGNGEPASIPTEAGALVGVEELTPLPDRLIVLNHGSNQLTTVSCEPLSAPSAGGG